MIMKRQALFRRTPVDRLFYYANYKYVVEGVLESEGQYQV